MITGAGFQWTQKSADDGLSVNWLEKASGDTTDEKLNDVRKHLRRTPTSTHRLVRLNVGVLKKAVIERAKADFQLSLPVAVLHDPLEADDQHPLPDPTHSIITGIPDGNDPQAEAVRDYLAACVKLEDVFLAQK